MARCAHMRTQRFLLASLLLLPFVFTFPMWAAYANGTTYYVGSPSDEYLMAASNGCDLPDNTTCSLHGALTLATGGADTITFSSNIPNAPTATTITLSQTVTPIASITLDGTGKHVILQGGIGRRPLHIPVAYIANQILVVTLIALTLTDGSLGNYPGGNVLNEGTLILNHTVVQNGAAGGVGGGIANTGTLLLTNGSVVTENTAGGNGGGIANTDGAALTIINSTVSGNTANGSDGGGVFNSNSSVMMTNSTVSGNTVVSSSGSGGSGGGIYSGFTGSATLTMTNATVSGNTANNSYGGGGGGIYLAQGTATITNSTVSGNTISGTVGYIGFAGGIYDGGLLILKNSLVAGNIGHNGTTSVDFYETSANHTFAYNLIGDGTGLSGNGSPDVYGGLIGVDPRFLSDPAIPQDFGGFTKTVALKADSPAIDVIPNASCPAADQRGVSRPQPAGGMCDIGAFESRHYILTASGGSLQSVIARHTAAPIVISVQDGNGALVSGTTVTFVAPTSGASGTFTGNVTTTTATTSMDGTAIAPPFTTNGIIGAIAITATFENVNLAVALTNIAPTITLAPITLSDATSGTSYPLQTFIATAGTGPYVYAIVSGLPPGLALGINDGTHNGQLTGTPSVVGAFAFIVSATDTDGFVGQASFALTVAPDITAVAPTSGDLRGGSSVTISGVGFVAGNTSVKIGGTVAMVTSITPTQITVIAPPGAAGTADIAVTVNGQIAVRAGIYRYGNVLSTPMAHATASATTTNVIPRPRPPTRPIATSGGNAQTPTPNPAPVRHQS